jgi:hypothetical protein
MFLVRVTVPSLRNAPGDDADKPVSGWRQRIWRRIVDWLTEPIPFPGKTYDLDPPPKQHRQEKETRPSDNLTRDSNERRQFMPSNELAGRGVTRT